MASSIASRSALQIEIAAAIAAVLTFSETKPFYPVNVPIEFEELSFFSKHDFWFYQTSPGACPNCSIHDNAIFTGDELLYLFPYLEIGNDNVIAVMVHPNCKCLASRITDPLDYLGLDMGVIPDWLQSILW